MNCLDHIHYCKAECCRQFSIRFNEDIKLEKGLYTFTGVFTNDFKHYLRLHRVIEEKNGVFKLYLNKFKQTPGKVMIYERCIALNKKNQCTVHALGTQPVICRTPNAKGEPLGEGCSVTENCLYKEIYERQKDV